MTGPAFAVLVVEDSDEDFDTVLEVLQTLGLGGRVRRATTGDHCLALLRGQAGRIALQPGFVLLDLNLPGLDGRDTLAEIRGDATLARLPVVVLSTSADPRDVAHCYARGANAYHVKPTSYPDYIQLLLRLLGYWLVEVVLPDPRGGRP